MSAVLSILGVLTLVGMAVCGGLLLHIGMEADHRNGIGRWLGLALVAVPYLLSVLLAFGLAWARGGFIAVWPEGRPWLRAAVLLAVALASAAVLVALAGVPPLHDDAALAAGLRRVVGAGLCVLLPVVGGLALFPGRHRARAPVGRAAWALLAFFAVAGAASVHWHVQRHQGAEQAAREREALAPGTQPWSRSKGRWAYDGKPFDPADAASLEPLSAVFARDAVQGYYRGVPVPGSHGPSFEALSANQARDRRAVYWADTYRRGQDYYLVRHVRIEAQDGADPAHYQVLRHGHGRDQRQAYFEGRRLPQVHDPASFEALTPRLARDARRAYFEHAEIPGSEGASFETVDRSFDGWVRDRHNAWYVGSGQPQKDGPMVRTVLRLDKAQPAALRALSLSYASDGRRVWWRGQWLKDADAASFAVIEAGTPDPSAAAPGAESADARDARGLFKDGKRWVPPQAAKPADRGSAAASPNPSR